MTFSLVAIKNIPKARVDGGTVRFFPVVTSTVPVVTYEWDFGDFELGLQYPPAHNSTYVKAYDAGASNRAYFATDPAKSLTGVSSSNTWLNLNDVNLRFHIDLGSSKPINKIYYENFHDSGLNTNNGVNNFTFWGSDTAASFAELTYGTDTGWTQLTTSQSTFDEHVAADTADPKYITVTNSTAYRYYAFKFADNHAGAAIGLRRVVLQIAANPNPSPMHTYSGASTYTFTVRFKCTDANGLASSTVTGTVDIAVAGDVTDAATDGSYESISCFLYNDTSSMMVNRTDTAFCSLFLMSPLVKNNIDFSTTSTFSILTPDTATAAERALMVEGTNVIMLQGNSIAFSGVVRRCTQNLQGGFTTSLPLQMWDFECDNDFFKLSKLNVNSTVLNTYGATIFDTPGNIARAILTPSGSWDWRGDICCNDAIVEYQTNPSTVAEQVPSQYEQLTNLQALTNYDLNSRMDYDQYTCNAFNGTTTVTVTGLAAAPSLVGYYLFFPNDTDGCKTFGKITSNSANTIVSTGLSVGDSATPAWVIVAKQPKIDFAPNLSTISNVETFNVNEDVFEYSDNDDKRKLYTKVIAKGKDVMGTNISVALAAVHAYDYDKQFYKDSTYLTKKMEGLIYKNGYITGGVSYGAPLTVRTLYLYGWGFALVPGDNIALFKIGGASSAVTIVTVGTPAIGENGVKYSPFVLSADMTYDYSGQGYLLSSKFYVEDNSKITTIGGGVKNCRIGEEEISIVSVGTGATGDWIMCYGATARDETYKCYPHGVGALVSRTNYTEASPETLSVYADYGCRINTITVETNTTYGSLDGYATALLLGFGAFYKKATCWMPLQHAKIKRVGGTPDTFAVSPNLTTMPRLGDMIGIVESSASTGATTDYQIVSETIKYDEGRIELQLGDYEKNIFTSIQKQTSGLNQTLT